MHERRLKGADDARLQLGNARGRAAEEAIAPHAPLPLQKRDGSQRQRRQDEDLGRNAEDAQVRTVVNLPPRRG